MEKLCAFLIHCIWQIEWLCAVRKTCSSHITLIFIYELRNGVYIPKDCVESGGLPAHTCNYNACINLHIALIFIYELRNGVWIPCLKNERCSHKAFSPHMQSKKLQPVHWGWAHIPFDKRCMPKEWYCEKMESFRCHACTAMKISV